VVARDRLGDEPAVARQASFERPQEPEQRRVDGARQVLEVDRDAGQVVVRQRVRDGRDGAAPEPGVGEQPGYGERVEIVTREVGDEGEHVDPVRGTRGAWPSESAAVWIRGSLGSSGGTITPVSTNRNSTVLSTPATSAPARSRAQRRPVGSRKVGNGCCARVTMLGLPVSKGDPPVPGCRRVPVLWSR